MSPTDVAKSIGIPALGLVLLGCTGKQPEPTVVTETKVVVCPEVLVQRTCPELPTQQITVRDAVLNWPLIQARDNCLVREIADYRADYQSCVERYEK